MSKIFKFLEIEEPTSWVPILRDVRFNEHIVSREPIFDTTEKILREFYQEYNKLLAEYDNKDNKSEFNI